MYIIYMYVCMYVYINTDTCIGQDGSWTCFFGSHHFAGLFLGKIPILANMFLVGWNCPVHSFGKFVGREGVEKIDLILIFDVGWIYHPTQ